MKIIYCIHSLSNSGGMERVLTIKANWLVNNGYDVSIYTYEKNADCFFNLDDRVKVINFYQGDSFILRARTLFSLLLSVNSYSPNYFISMGGKDRYFNFLVEKKIIKILEWHFSYTTPIKHVEAYNLGSISKVMAYARMFFNKKICLMYNKTIVLTEKDKKYWNYAGCNNVEVIQNPITDNDNDNDNDKKSIGSSFRFISVGRLDHQKNFHELIEIFNEIYKKNRNIILDIYGDGELKTDLIRLIHKKELSNVVFLHGNVKDIREKYDSADCYLMTSVYEGLPMVLLEALSASLPIIAYDCDCGPSDLIVDDYNGYLIYNRERERFINKALLLSLNTEMVSRFSSASKELSYKFDFDNIMNKWRSVFDNK